jgi:transposase
MNHESLLVFLPDSQAEAKSMKEIAQDVGLEISTYTDWIRAERKLARPLVALMNEQPGRYTLIRVSGDKRKRAIQMLTL